MFVTERVGNVLVFASGDTGAPRIANLAVDAVQSNNTGKNESGLMGIALDPAFAGNGLIYVCATRADPEAGGVMNQVLRYRFDGGAWTFDRYVIRTGMRAGAAHDGCRIRFDRTGKLWITMGESGIGALAQDPNSLNGKLLRINADGTIPEDNPTLPGAAARSAAYSWGHRNPQGIAFSGDRVYDVEHGEDDDDEINLIEPGANYGWPIVHQTGGAARGMKDPLWSSGNVTFATAGATFVSGFPWGSWSGSLFVAALKDESLRRFTADGTSVAPQEVLLRGKYGRLRAAVQGPDGALYLTTSNRDGRAAPGSADDRIVRVVASQP